MVLQKDKRFKKRKSTVIGYFVVGSIVGKKF